MARSYGVLKISVWEPGSDFRALSPLAQWAYTMLISQPQISNLGVLSYTPEKWQRLAAGLTAAQLHAALEELQAERYTIVDEDTAELLVRTFVKHDKVWSQWQLVANARKLIREVESEEIRGYLIARHPWLVEDWAADCPSQERKPRLQHEMEAIRSHEEPVENTPLPSGKTPVETPLSPEEKTPVKRGVGPARDRAGARAGAGPGEGAGPSTEDLPDQNPPAVDAARANGATAHDQEEEDLDPDEPPVGLPALTTVLKDIP